MILDLIAAALVVMLTVLGWRNGMLRTVASFGAFIAASVLAGPLGVALVPTVAGWMPEHPGLVEPAATLVAGAGLYCVLLLLGSIVVRFLRMAKLVVRADRMLGLVLGVAKGLALSYLLACFAVLLDAPLREAYPTFGAEMDASETVRLAREVNLMEELWPPKPRGRLEAPGSPPTPHATAPPGSPPPPAPPAGR